MSADEEVLQELLLLYCQIQQVILAACVSRNDKPAFFPDPAEGIKASLRKSRPKFIALQTVYLSPEGKRL